MKYIKQFGIILAISFLGEILRAILPFPIPASLYGILLLFLALESKLLPLSEIRETGKFLIAIMPLMFIPPLVGLIDVWDILKDNWLSLFLISLLSTAIIMAFSGLVTQWAIRFFNKKRKGEDR